MKKTTRWTLPGAGAALAVLLALALPAPATAADSDVTWSVTPAGPDGPDGRGLVRQEVDPGQTREDYLAVKNLSRSTVTFTLRAADGYYTETGRFSMLPSNRESVDAGRWITLPDTITVEPNETEVVPFTTRVPDDALPGDHAAGIAASLLSSGTDASGSRVGVESRVGFRVMTRVTGEIVSAYEVSGVSSSYDQFWNPFVPGAASVSFDVRNSGNVSVVLEGRVTTGTGAAAFPADGAAREELLPGESRSVTVTVPDVWPTFFVPGTIDLAPTAQTVGGAAVDVVPTATPLSLWALPLPHLVAVTGVALLLGAVLWRRRRFLSALEAARAEGRASAAASRAESSPPAARDAAGPRRSRRTTLTDGGDLG